MDKSAILHIPLSRYAFASKEKELTIRIRTKRNDLTSCTLYYGDRACNHTPVTFTSLNMSLAAADELFDYYEATFESPYIRVCYYFRLEQGEEWTYYYADEFTKELPDLTVDGKVIEGRSEYYQYPFILRDEVVDVPAWFKEAVVYNIFPDSFANGVKSLKIKQTEQIIDGNTIKNRLGGTLRGIIDNLEYISDLGFNCIYLNPIFLAGEYHKYDILDYFHIDPCLGSDDDFRELVEKIHEKGMRIIIDGVFNHCSWRFFAFNDVVTYGENSIFKDWFYDLTYPVIRPEDEKEIPSYACFAYERKMPKLNTSNLEVQEFFEKVCKHWIREYDIDGWRLDVANEIDRNFWRRFKSAAKEEKKDIVLIGEVWENSETWLRGDAFDSTMNYDFRKHCRDFFALGKISAETFAGRTNYMRLRYATNTSNGQLNLLDSHDVPRFLSLCHNDMNRWKLALIFLMLAPGVPSLFYGDEKGISGITENEYRSPMDWENCNLENHNLECFVKEVIAIRKKHINHTMSFLNLPVKEGSNLYSFQRYEEKDGKNIIVYLNASNQSEKIEIVPDSKPLILEGIENGILKPWGYGVYFL